MYSYFGDLYNIEQFAIGFDLIGDHLSEDMITDITAEIEELLDDFPDIVPFITVLKHALDPGAWPPPPV